MYDIDLQGVSDDLTKALRDIRGECIFFACPGWNKPFLSGATCKICYAVQLLDELNAEIKGHLEEQPADEEDIPNDPYLDMYGTSA